MRILFLNQYFPPDPAPTGILLWEVGQALARVGHEVEFVSARQDYRAGQRQRGRIFRELKALTCMLVDAVTRPRVDLVISATSPACLLFVATLIAKRHRAQSIHWIMDLYPEIALAMGELKPGLGVSLLERLMKWSYGCCRSVVALDSDMAAHLQCYGIRAEVIRPWVPESGNRTTDGGDENFGGGGQRSEDGSSRWSWIYSGNLGRAHEWETLLQAQALLEQNGSEIRLVFQGGGPSWAAAQARARELGLKQCDWVPYVAENQLRDSLLACQCLIVSQLPSAQGLLWPSKLALLLSLPRPILWVGPTEGAVARQLSEFPQTATFAPGQAPEIARWLCALQARSGMPMRRLDASLHRSQSLSQWRKLADPTLLSDAETPACLASK